MLSALLSSVLAFAPATVSPGERVLVLEPVASAASERDRERLSDAMTTRLAALGVAIVDGDVRSAARACRSQVCLDRTASAHGITHWARAEITGDDRDYRVRVVVGRFGGEDRSVTSDAECLICGMVELGDSVAQRTEAAWQALAVREHAESSSVPKVVVAHPTRERPRDGARASAMQPAGIALLAAGSASVVGGAVLLGIDGREIRSRCSPANTDADGDCRYVHDTKAGGIALVTVGIVSAAAGITLVSIDRHRHKTELRARLGYNRIVLEGRF